MSPSAFVPRLYEGTTVVNSVRLASVSSDESVRYGTQIERVLLEAFAEKIEQIWTRTGAAEVATDPMGVELSDVFVTLWPCDEWTRARTQDESRASRFRRRLRWKIRRLPRLADRRKLGLLGVSAAAKQVELRPATWELCDDCGVSYPH